jgi:predicted ATPase
LADDFLDGVWVIELAAVGDPAAVPEAVAAVLGITQQPQMTIAESVATALEDRSRLLIVDNCEHVLDAAADMIEAILARSATVKVIATSREGLRVADEQLWPVPSLDVRTSAVDLFVERAHGVAPGISLNEDVGAVTEICRRLDGIPLAIELAASRMQSMTAMFTKRAFPEIGSTIDHLREVLGAEAYEALASRGASMTNAAMTAYALEQIDGVRAELLHEDDAP